jgi:hypothetical protein
MGLARADRPYRQGAFSGAHIERLGKVRLRAEGRHPYMAVRILLSYCT